MLFTSSVSLCLDHPDHPVNPVALDNPEVLASLVNPEDKDRPVQPAHPDSLDNPDSQAELDSQDSRASLATTVLTVLARHAPASLLVVLESKLK